MTETLTRHRYSPPPDLDATDPLRYPIVIIGAGSVGLTLALGLARQGVPSVVLERSDTVTDGSRALGMSRRTMEIWESLGVAEPILDIGLPWNSGRSYFRDCVVADFEMPHDAKLRHAPMLNIAQWQVDEILVDALEQTGLVDLRWQTELVGVETSERGGPGDMAASAGPVVVTVATPDGRYRLVADRLVACDGGRSTVRSLLDLRLEGTSFDSRYLIVDVALDSEYAAGRRAWFDPPSNPGSTVLMHRQPGNIWRLDYQLRPDDDLDEVLTPASVAARVDQHLAMIGETGSAEIKWISSYRANSACLADFQSGSVLFAGDAAHLIPIFGIRGLNSGVEDVWTLAWKLASVHRGTAGQGLLPSYSFERVAAARENMAAANRSTRVMTPDTPGLELMRDATLSLAIDRLDVREILNPRQGAPTSVLGSPLNTTDDEAGFSGGPSPGESLPDVEVEAVVGGRIVVTHLLALLDPTSFHLLVFGDSPGEVGVTASDRALRVITAVGAGDDAAAGTVVIIDAGDELADRLDATPGTAYLVRPDHLVCARWRGVDRERVDAALATAWGETLCPAPPSSVAGPELNAAERRYRALAAAVDAAGDAAPLLLAKFALVSALGCDDEEFERRLSAAAMHLEPVDEPEGPS